VIDDALGFALAASVLVALIFAVVAASSVLAIAAVPGAVGYAIYWHQVKSPTARERQQKERTWALYKSVKRKFTKIDVPAYIGDRVGFPADDDPNVDLQNTIASRLFTFENLDD